ncbi:MAG: glutathione S-transferase N-terminal domain-containing protein [Castellaniella sp.]
MKLYYLPGACPLASHIALIWAGENHELQAVARDELKQAPFLALNPAGAVPVLEDGDFILTQSSAILEYIAERNPHSGLLPDDLRARAEVRRWLAFCNADLHRTFALLFAAPRYVGSEAAQAELIEGASRMLVDLFAIAERQLEGREWIAGSRSIADPYLYTLLRWAQFKQVPLDGMDNLKAFFARMEADPGVQAALVAEGLQAPR